MNGIRARHEIQDMLIKRSLESLKKETLTREELLVSFHPKEITKIIKLLDSLILQED